MKATITAAGHYLPEKRLTNQDLEKLLDTSDEWLIKRTGMRERRIAREDQFTKDLAILAVEDLKKKYPEALDGVDLIITSSMTPDYYCPNVSSLIQAHFGLKKTGAIDLNSACSGFVYSLLLANGMIESKMAKKVLIIAAETMSKVLDYTDRTTCVLFGDGAGAMILEASGKGDIHFGYMDTEGEEADAIYCSGLSNQIGEIKGYFAQNGQKVFKWAISNVSSGIQEMLSHAKTSIDDIDWFLPHGANDRIVNAIAKKINLEREKVITSLEYTANTSSATIPIAFSKALVAGKLKKGDTLLLYGFGGGLTQAGAIVTLNSLKQPL